MTSSGVSLGNSLYGIKSPYDSLSGLGGAGARNSDAKLKQAEDVAEEGFQQTMAARRITNRYAAAKEIR